MKKIAISQSNYLPWKGFFDLISRADIFVIYDEMQFTKNDWRNRNQIKTEQGLKWITIPVDQANKFGQKINEALVVDDKWRSSHWSSIKQAYSHAKFFKDYSECFEELYFGNNSKNLSEINLKFLKVICGILEIKTEFILSKNLSLEGDRVERLVNICNQLKANTYVSSATAKSYMTDEKFVESGIEVEWLEFQGHPEYRQLYGDFVHHVSIIDVIFNEGPEAKKFIVSEQ